MCVCLAAGDEHDQQLDRARVKCDRRPVPLQGHHARVWRGERRGLGVHERQAGHRQPTRPARHAVRNSPARVRRLVRAGRRPDSLDLSRHRHRHQERSKLLFGVYTLRLKCYDAKK